MKIYIAGKVTGLPKDKIFKKFCASAKMLKETGHITMSPAVLLLNEGFEHGEYMHICYAMIDVCDAVYMQKDWQHSKGAQMELYYAKDTKKQIIYEDESTVINSNQRT
ncbi:MAG: DUF4406 domain-containing protein [Bacteroides sp.]|nr:DUF4406 domain-containing protein [Prevotella sp.]MCM1407086.1 DUF4406 domain-containing protein [Treponema brennaborense]MCM1470238.1 DUF4406 domain-containing protein [Bacteroides sp.]